jgi:hypothetical protein
MSKFEKLDKQVKKLIDNTDTKMNKLIEKYNESLNEDSDDFEVDTVDLHNLFVQLKEYCTDYTQ